MTRGILWKEEGGPLPSLLPPSYLASEGKPQHPWGRLQGHCPQGAPHSHLKLFLPDFLLVFLATILFFYCHCWILCIKDIFFLSFKIYLFIYLWLCWVFVSVRGLSLVEASGGHSSSRCAGLSLSRPLLLWSTGSRRAGSVVVAHGPSCSTACGIFPDQGSNPCPLHWQADSQPLHHQGSPRHFKKFISLGIGEERVCDLAFLFYLCLLTAFFLLLLW